MDGLLDTVTPCLSEIRPQRTLRARIGCVGVGLHSGHRISMTLIPAPAGHGIVFRRVDLDATIPARFDHVIDTTLCTVLADPSRPQARVSTVEHLMAALAGCGVDNVLVEVDGPELPILDGSADPFVFLIDCAGLTGQDAAPVAIEVLRPVSVRDGEAFAELRPGPFGLDLSVSIAFQDAAIGRQALSLRLTEDGFRDELARARTFARRQDVAQMQAAGLARGGSLDNAIVVEGDQVLNPGGLRMANEFVRHKMLDVVGDLALAGGALHGRFISHRGGHALNNKLLRELFADAANWRPVVRHGAGASMIPLQAAAAPA